MKSKAGILDLLRREGAEALKRSRRAVIIQPGAVGDCILTLPLAKFIKENLNLGAVEIIGRSEYISYFPTRTCIDAIRSLDSIDLHRLFSAPGDFCLAKPDSLIDTFAGYSWILSFIGRAGDNFEQNLIFTANCSQSAEVVLLDPKPDKKKSQHISRKYINYLCDSFGLKKPHNHHQEQRPLIKTHPSDRQIGMEILASAGVTTDRSLVVLSPGSGHREKCWHLNNYLNLALQMPLLGIDPLFLLGPAEMERFSHESIKAIHKTAPVLSGLSLTEVLQMLSAVDAYVGNDSGITHLAAAAALPTIALFGQTNPAVYRPIGPDVSVIQVKSPNFARRPSKDIQQKVMSRLDEICA